MTRKFTILFILTLSFLLAGMAQAGNLVINEIHADPAGDISGDANGDGTRSSSQDEFVEIVNANGSSVDLSGWTLSDGYGVRHTFPAGTVLSSKKAIVVFGGGIPTGSFGGAIVQTASTGTLGLNNGGDTVTLSDGNSIQIMESFGSEGGDNQSLTRDPDLSGGFVKHSSATGSNGALFSPGTKINGESFRSQCQAPVAGFEAQETEICSGHEVVLTNTSTGDITSWTINWGDGYTETGSGDVDEWKWNYLTELPVESFTVSLTVRNQCGEDELVMQDYITVIGDVVAGFTTQQNEICSGEEVVLQNTSSGEITNYSINWGDGTVLISPNPPTDEMKHIYTTELPVETFTVSMVVEGQCSNDVFEKYDYITVYGPIAADFTVSETEGVAPMEVQFCDLSQGKVTSWLWDFGDGTISEEQNPTHVYTGDQKHISVKLTVSGPCDEQTVVKSDYITVNRAVKVDFEAAPIVGSPGLEVQFTNKSGGNANLFVWNYGDGLIENVRQDFKTVVHPYHIYNDAGEYDVCVKASGHGGEDELTLPGLIYVDAAYKVCELELIEAGETYPGNGWENAIDNDIYGSGAIVAGVAGDAWAVFGFADSTGHEVQKIRLLTDTVSPNTMTTNLLNEFEIWASPDGLDFGAEAVFYGTSAQKDGIWEEFVFNTPVEAKYLKVVLKSSRGEHAKYCELAELQVFSPTETALMEKREAAKNTELPVEFTLEQNYPNPFNPSTNIRFHLPEEMAVTLAIYNLQGQLIRTLANGNMSAGIYNFVWNAKNMKGDQVAGGVYIYQLKAVGAVEKVLLNRKMLLMK